MLFSVKPAVCCAYEYDTVIYNRLLGAPIPSVLFSTLRNNSLRDSLRQE